MRRIGLVGGLGCESTAIYFERVNALVRAHLGGLNTADVLVSSPNFDIMLRHRQSGADTILGAALADNAECLARAGAEVIVLCGEPPAAAFEAVAIRLGTLSARSGIRAELVDVVATTGGTLEAFGCDRPAVLSVHNAAEQDAYVMRLRDFGVQARVPRHIDGDLVRALILGELCTGQVAHGSRDRLLGVIEREADAGANGIVFAAPELSMLLDPSDLICPGFDASAYHAEAAVEAALRGCTLPGSSNREGEGAWT